MTFIRAFFLQTHQSQRAASPPASRAALRRYVRDAVIAEDLPWFFGEGVCDCHICRNERGQSNQEALHDSDILPLPNNASEEGYNAYLKQLGYAKFDEDEESDDESDNDEPAEPVKTNLPEEAQRCLRAERATQIAQGENASVDVPRRCPHPLTVNPKSLALSGGEIPPSRNVDKSAATHTAILPQETLQQDEDGSSSGSVTPTGRYP
ncbi:hypothetical protein NUW54_g5575 [Trametes sanguinea]|uniref:Uncharacterized protein n=1 Tax=Trametes sanguinea TaxID=158606 RepID=A0ACC1PUR6_9APHY|nr:hypothetical protein NUW54_g5575 [Trametes sanguinea]